MKHFLRKFFILCLLFVTSTRAYSLTLEEALVAVYKDNPNLKAAREKAKSSDEQIMQALSLWLPVASFSLSKQYRKSGGYDDISRDRFGQYSTTVAPQSSDGVISGITVKQNLYRSGADVAQLNAARSAIKVAHATLEDAEQDVFQKVIKAYTETLQNHELYKTAQERESDNLKQLEGTRQKVAVGALTKTDLARIESEYAQSQAQRLIRKANYESSKASLESWIGTEVKNLIAPSGTQLLPKNISDTIDTALLRNPDVIIAKNSLDVAKSKVDAAKGTVLPQVDLEYNVSDHSKYKELSGPKRSYTTAISLTIPILNVKEWSDLRITKRDAAQQSNALQAQLDNIRSNATNAWVAFEANKASLKAAKDSYEAMKLAYAGKQASEKVGLVSMFEMVQTRKDYFEAYNGYIIQKAVYYQSMYGLKAIVGECTARGLKLNVPLYDPRDNYNSIKWQIIGAF